MKPVIISIIGAPGVGKSFLTEKLAKQLNAEFIIEDIKKIPKRIIENLKNNTRPMETVLWFRNIYIENIEKAHALKQKGKIVVTDSCLITNELHITTMVAGFKQKVILKQAKFDKKYIPKPDVIIFLDASDKVIKSFTLKRNRDFDTNNEYIKRNLSISKAHKQYYQKNKNSLLYINRDGLDFNKKEDLLKVIDKIKSNYV